MAVRNAAATPPTDIPAIAFAEIPPSEGDIELSLSVVFIEPILSEKSSGHMMSNKRPVQAK